MVDSLEDYNRILWGILWGILWWILWWILIGFSEGLVPVAPIQGRARLANALG